MMRPARHLHAVPSPGSIRLDRAARELLFLTYALRYVIAHMEFLSPGINTNHRNYMELIAEKAELTRRVERATLESKGKTLDEKPVRTMSYGNVVFLFGGARRAR